ncbi:MAG: ABC transporter substrate-binding protein [Candidatus Bipolaricaulia bacterium]
MAKELVEQLEKGRITRRSFLKGMGLAAGTAALTSVFGFRGFGQAPVTIGAIHPMTGALAEFGPPEVYADELAADHLNEAAGRQLIKLAFGDTQTAAAAGIAEANRLVDVLGVPALIGAAASGVTIPVAQSVCIPKKVLQISYASTSPMITGLDDNDFLFRTCPSDALQGVVAGRLAWELGFRTASTMYVNNPYGQGLSNVFCRTFEAMGGKCLAEVPHPEEVQPSYVAELQQALAGKPDVVHLPTYPGQAVVFMREAIEQFGFNSWLFTDGTRSELIPQTVGAANVEGMYGTAPGAAETPSLDVFNSTYEKKYGRKPPLPFLDTSYDAVIVAGLAVALAQKAGQPVTGAVLRSLVRSVAGFTEPIKEALKARGHPVEPVVTFGAGVEELGKAFDAISQAEKFACVTIEVGGRKFEVCQMVPLLNYEGAAGAVDFDENGDVVTPIDVWQYKNGVPVTIEKRLP